VGEGEVKVTRGPVRSPDDFLIFGSPLIGAEEKREVLDCLDTGWIGSGPKVTQFEKEFAAYQGADHAVGVHSCTAALHLSLLAAGIVPGDEVITTSLTFCATVNSIIHAGGTPVLVDVERHTMNIDPVHVEVSITDRTRAIVPVHFAGRPCNLEALVELAERHDLVLIEDCAHAVETLYRGQHTGTFGDFGCFSFYVTKNLATGEGGMVVTPNEEHARHVKTLSLHGLSADAWKRFGDEGYRHYKASECGFKYNMMDLQAALGIHQLRRLEANWERRRDIWAVYQEEFGRLPLRPPEAPEADTRHAFHLYTVLVDKHRTGLGRDEFLQGMTAENVGVGVHYESIPRHPYYQETFGWRPEQFPVSDEIGQQTVSLPLSAKLSDGDVDDVISAVRRVLGVD